MDEVLTMEEIEARFPEEWILIDKPEKDQFGRVAGGRVVYHGPDREEIYRKALEIPSPRHIAFHCTKKRKPGVVYIL
jgi:hypothetical protein